MHKLDITRLCILLRKNLIKEHISWMEVIMKNDRKINGIEKDEDKEDVTKYGEFISSYFAWVTPERQKKRAKELDNMTKKDETKK